MGIETTEAFQMMDTMGDVLSDEAVTVGAVNVFELAGRDKVAIQQYSADITFVYDNVDVVGVNVDVFVVESGEGDLINALFDGGNPNYRRVSNGIAATGCVVKIHSSRP